MVVAGRQSQEKSEGEVSCSEFSIDGASCKIPFPAGLWASYPENVGQPPSAVPSGCTAGGGGVTHTGGMAGGPLQLKPAYP